MFFTHYLKKFRFDFICFIFAKIKTRLGHQFSRHISEGSLRGSLRGTHVMSVVLR